MSTLHRRALASALALIISGPAFAQSREAPTDAVGRPLRSSSGQKLVYDAGPAQDRTPIASASQVKPSQRITSKGRRSRALQSTGLSPSYYEQWRATSFGSGIGATGFWPLDVDDDGRDELVMGGGSGFGGNQFWSIVGFDSTTGQYEIRWQSAPSSSSDTVSALRVVEVGGAKHVWVGRADGVIEVVNAVTHVTLHTWDPGEGEIHDFAFADADNDGVVDLVAGTTNALLLYDSGTFALRRSIPHGAERLVIGNVDADGRNEIVLDTGRVLDVSGGTTTVQWQTTSFGARLELADIDADGMAELVAAESWDTIRAWDLDTRSQKWSIEADHDVTALRLIDVAGDATPEILYGDGQWGSIHAIDAVTRTQLWEIENPEHGVTDIAVVDADHDGAREVLWGAGWSSTGPDYLFVHDLATRAHEWQSVDYSGPYEAVDIADVDADGRPELVVASYESESGYGDGLLMVFDAATHALEWRSSSDLFEGQAWTGIHGLKLANLDNDPQLEIVVTTDRLYDGALYVIDGASHEVQHVATYDDGSPLGPIDVVDLDGDAQPEVVTGNFIAHTGSPGVHLYVLNPASATPVWRSASLSSHWTGVTDVLAADVGLPGVDLLAVDEAVHVIRWSDRRQLASAGTNYLAVAAQNVSGGAEREILAGRIDGVVDVLDGETLALITSHQLCNEPIRALMPHDAGQVLAACGSDLIVYDLSSASAADVTGTPVAELGRRGALSMAMVGNRAVVLAGGSAAIKFADLSGNSAPVLSPMTGAVHWRGVVDLQISASDAEGDPLRFEFVSLPRRGAVTWLDSGLGLLRYQAAGAGGGQETFRIRVWDGARYSAEETVTINLTNTPPTAMTQRYTPITGVPMSSRVSAGDADGDPLTYAVAQQPSFGAFELDADSGEFTYTPAASGSGVDTVIVLVSDGVTQTQAVLEFRYGAPGTSVEGGGGGSMHWWLLVLLALMATVAERGRSGHERWRG